MKHLLLTLAASFSLLLANAQNIEAVRILASNNPEACQDVAYDTVGNLFVAGSFNATLNFDVTGGSYPLTATTGSDGFVAKYDELGAIQWARQVEGNGTVYIDAITTAPEGSVYLTGYFYDTLDLDPGPAVVNGISAGSKDIFLIKLDANGIYEWGHTWGNSTNNDEGFDLTCDRNNNIYMSGVYTGPVDFDPGPGTAIETSTGTQDNFVLKLDPNGNFTWVKTVGTAGGEFLSGIDCDTADNIVVAGQFWDTMDADPNAGVFNIGGGGFNSHGFVLKWSPAGNFIWAKWFDGSNNEIPRSVVVHSNDEIYLCGSFRGTTDFDPGAGVANLTAVGSYDAFLLHLDANGNYLQGVSWGGTATDDALGVSITQSGDVYLGGFFSGTVDFDPGPGNSTYTSTGGSDLYVSKFSSNLTYDWTVAYGANSTDQFYNIVAFEERVNYCGYFRFTVDFSGGQGTAVYSSLLNGLDGYFLEFDNCPITYINESTTICNGDSALIFGNWESVAGTYSDTIDNHPSCDTIILHQLSLYPTQFSATAMVCSGDSVFLEGAWQTVAGSYVDTFTAIVTGCDSIVTTTLSLWPVYSISTNSSICTGDSLFVGGGWQTAAGTYVDSFLTTNSCDSIITTTLSLWSVYNDTLSAGICVNDSFFVGGNWQTNAGLYVDSLVTQNGCDSVVYTQLAVFPVYTDSMATWLCDGDSLFVGGAWQTAPGFYTDSMLTMNGCDSLEVTELLLHPTWSFAISMSICEGDSAFINNQWESTAGTYQEMYSTVNGCDSIWNITLVVNPLPVIDLGPDTSYCQEVPQIVVSSNSSGYNYLWSTMDTTSSITLEPLTDMNLGPNTITLTATTDSGCIAMDTVIITIDLCGGIGELQQSPLQLYPIPARTELHVTWPAEPAGGVLVVLNASGTVVEETPVISSPHVLNVSSLPPGVYFIEVRQGQAFFRGKFVK